MLAVTPPLHSGTSGDCQQHCLWSLICNVSRCPSNEELSPLAQRFFPFPRFPVAKDPKLYIICVDGVPRLNTCTAGTLFSEATLSCEEQS